MGLYEVITLVVPIFLAGVLFWLKRPSLKIQIASLAILSFNILGTTLFYSLCGFFRNSWACGSVTYGGLEWVPLFFSDLVLDLGRTEMDYISWLHSAFLLFPAYMVWSSFALLSSQVKKGSWVRTRSSFTMIAAGISIFVLAVPTIYVVLGERLGSKCFEGSGCLCKGVSYYWVPPKADYPGWNEAPHSRCIIVSR